MPQQAVDMTGQRVGRLLIVSRAENTKQNKAQWLCRCDCGNEVIVSRRSLKDASTTSCGCYQREAAAAKHRTHGMKKTRLYRIWSGMKDRCFNSRGKYFDRYGKVGRTMCDEWANSFEAFYEWAMSNGYSDELTIDRINNDDGYSPNNCRWATWEQQENNRNDNIRIEYAGETHGVREWSRITGMPTYVIYSRYKRWADPMRIFGTPYSPVTRGGGK